MGGCGHPQRRRPRLEEQPHLSRLLGRRGGRREGPRTHRGQPRLLCVHWNLARRARPCRPRRFISPLPPPFLRQQRLRRVGDVVEPPPAPGQLHHPQLYVRPGGVLQERPGEHGGQGRELAGPGRRGGRRGGEAGGGRRERGAGEPERRGGAVRVGERSGQRGEAPLRPPLHQRGAGGEQLHELQRRYPRTLPGNRGALASRL